MIPDFASVDEADAYRQQTIVQLESLQAKMATLKARHDVGPQYQEMLGESRVLAQQLREIKTWMRVNASTKPSEYQLLGQCYHLLVDLEEAGVEIRDEGERLLTQIEMQVPHIYLVRSEANRK